MMVMERAMVELMMMLMVIIRDDGGGEHTKHDDRFAAPNKAWPCLRLFRGRDGVD